MRCVDYAAREAALRGAEIKSTCHPDWSEAEWRDLRSLNWYSAQIGAKVLRLALLAQDDRGFLEDWECCAFETAQGGAKVLRLALLAQDDRGVLEDCGCSAAVLGLDIASFGG